MRRSRRGITLTELLVVISVMTILAAMVAPVLMRAVGAANQTSCKNNMMRLYQGFQIYANMNNGKLPQCYDVNIDADSKPDSVPHENTWWFRKVANLLYTDQNPLDINVGKFRNEMCVLRCPASPDHYNQARTAAIVIPKTTGAGAVEKDRVYDNHYGYNNWGFRYSNTAADKLKDPRTLSIGRPGTSPLYHTAGTIVGYYETTPARPKDSYIGDLADVPYAGSTILLMDYIKGDIAPMGGSSSGTYNDNLFGFRFRHGSNKVTSYDMKSAGTSNVLFVDGHIAAYTAGAFAATLNEDNMATSSLHFKVSRKR